jgi:metallophosphoesterase superfamily enzyme
MVEKDYRLERKSLDYEKIFLLSDLHFGVRSNSLEWLVNHKNFFYDFYIPFLKKYSSKGDVLWILGDWFDNRQLLDIYVMNTSIDIIIDIAKVIPVHFLIGNHDIYKKYDTDINSIAAFRHIPNVYIYEKPVIITNGRSEILILPWVGDYKEEQKIISMNPTQYVFAHTDIAGFQYDNNRLINRGLDVSAMPALQRLFSGHIHKRQESGKLIYIGCPYHTKRSDIGNDKAVYMFDPQTNTIVKERNTYSPIFQRLSLESLLELTLEQTSKVLANNYTDILVPDKYIHMFNLTAFVDVLKDCKFKKIETSIDQKRLDTDVTDLSDEIDIKDILSLVEASINDLGYKMEVLVKLKLLNKAYYDKAYNEKEEIIF